MKSLLTLAATALSLCLLAQEKGLSPITSNGPNGPGTTYAVVVGISDYQDPGIPDLRFADKDAEAFANFLRSPVGGSLDEDHLKVLINEQATMAQFAIALDWLWEVVQEGDRVLIYFSGHGDVERKSLTQPGFLLCWDAPARVYLAGGTLALPMFQEVISTLSVQNKATVIVITDACRSGKLSGSSVGGSQLTSSNLSRQYANEIKILSCQPNEYSVEGDQWGGGRGAFSYHLLDGLYGLADGNADGTVNLKEIARYLEDRVSEEVSPQHQNPMTIGSVTEPLTDVHPEMLAQLKAGRKGQMPLFATTDSRGLEGDVLEAADSNVVNMYAAFQKAIVDKRFMDLADAPASTDRSADSYYQVLSREPSLTPLHSSMRRNFAAALQDDAQQVMNSWLESDVDELNLSRITRAKKYQPYVRYLERSAELLGKEHYMYSVLMARKLFFEGVLLSMEHMNPDKELGTAALEKFRGALLLQPHMPHAYYSMSKVFAYNMLQPDSMEFYTRLAMEHAPSWVIPPIVTAQTLLKKYRQFDRSEYYLGLADQIDSNSVLALSTRGLLCMHTRRLGEAETHLLKAIQIDSNYIGAYNTLGELCGITQRYDKAETYFLEAFQRDSTLTEIINNLGVIYSITQQYEKAETYYKKTLQLDSSITQVYANLGRIYNITGRYDESETYLLRSIQLDSTLLESCINLAELYLNLHRYAEAEKMWQKSIRIDSTNWVSFARLGGIYQSLSRWEDSESATLKAIELGPPMYELVALLGNAYTHLPGRLEDARTTLDKAIDMAPRRPGAYVYLAQWNLKMDQTEEAWKNLELGLKKGKGKKEISLVDLQEAPDFEEMRKDVRWDALMKTYFPTEPND